MISKELLELLQCPEDRSPLSEAPTALIERLNHAIAAGRLKNRGGADIERRIEGGLLRRDGTLLYPIFAGIPNMLMDEAIPLAQVADSF